MDSSELRQLKARRRDSSHSFWSWFIGYVLVALIWFGVGVYERDQERQQEQERIDHSMTEIRDAVRRGEGGEALNQLFPEEHAQFLDEQRQQAEGIAVDEDGRHLQP